MQKMNNLLLVAGTNRNVGKTTFCCKVISKLVTNHEVWAIKITPHIHSVCPSCKIIHQTNDLIISEELSAEQNKDSSKMLAAGATKVFYIQGSDGQLPQVVQWIKESIPLDIPIVCESAAIRHFIEPGCFVILSKTDLLTKHTDLIKMADYKITDFKYDLSGFVYFDEKWQGLILD